MLVDDRRLDAGHARQRTVLACLLVDVNRAVTADQLIDRVWSDEPPHRSRNALAAYISRLRRLLAETGAAEIVRGPGGYALRTDPLNVDLHKFRSLAAAARACGTPAETAAMFDDALRLWRAEPLVFVDTPWANGLREALEREHWSAVLGRNDASLDIGRRGNVLGDVTAAFEQHPMDERLAGQLMLALYLSGRQADALDTYRVTRNRLVDELGVDPGPSLQAIHQRILDGDAALVPAPAQPTSTTSEPLTTLSAPPRGVVSRRATRLVGRDDDVRRVVGLMDEAQLVTLTGVGGVGKTRLSLEVAGRRQENYADGVWICELAPLDDDAPVTHAVASALRLPPRHGALDQAVVDFLRDRELLLVVDNCEHVIAGAAQLLDDVTRQCPRVRVLATSREALGVEGERVLPVNPLDEAAAAELFADRARATRPDFDPGPEPVGAVAEICRRLDGVPLAIELAAARMRAMGSLDIARRLDRLRLLSGGAPSKRCSRGCRYSPAGSSWRRRTRSARTRTRVRTRVRTMSSTC